MANIDCPDVPLQMILLGLTSLTHTPQELKTRFNFAPLL